ncbi:uncharacterized protein BDW70DRAFT_160990 [Aspergillus foveolatus]|uniref:uncharacterized protein n=1 Tax=Aspergillus foveolatus TaxID=210207 RepID=UPI003CCC9371
MYRCLTAARLKCKICKKSRDINTYSKRQLDIFRNAFVVQGQRALTTGHATWRGCTSGQVMELRCCRCLVCVQGHKDAEPVIDENKLLAEGDLLSTMHGTITNVGSTLTGSTSVALLVMALAMVLRLLALLATGKGLSSYISQRKLAAFNANSIHSGWASFGVQRSEAAASVLSDGREGKFAKVKTWRPEEVSHNNPIRAREVAKKAGGLLRRI